ncbi:chromosomal replication initiator DnaA [Rhizosaccharibacter radicis]|uniref:Chromosomal replication initiator DnaA n=1 Tax=Rhizosaccharibacter radicis TaxID=2782605 RepID=A0ABT1VXW0_9PROT|nr:chromosomal replication initiator DnaA [Acetobacteraceae bacterium KSS12]
MPFPHQPRFERGNFVAAPSNREALAWLGMPAAGWPERRLALWGEAGIGKTHLLHVWAAEHGAVLLPGTALRRPEDGVAFEGATAVAVDDADEAPDEHALLHLLNRARLGRTALLLSGRAPPSRWAARLPDLASRLRAVSAVRLHPPEDALLRTLLARLLAERQLPVPPRALGWMLHRLPRTTDAVRDAARRLDELALAGGTGVTRRVLLEALEAVTLAGGGEKDLPPDLPEMPEEGAQVVQPPLPALLRN